VSAPHRAKACPPTANFVLTKYKCERLRGNLPAGGDATRLDAVGAKHIVRWLPVEYGWKDLWERHCLTVMPDEVPTTTAALLAARFFVH